MESDFECGEFLIRINQTQNNTRCLKWRGYGSKLKVRAEMRCGGGEGRLGGQIVRWELVE